MKCAGCEQNWHCMLIYSKSRKEILLFSFNFLCFSVRVSSFGQPLSCMETCVRVVLVGNGHSSGASKILVRYKPGCHCHLDLSSSKFTLYKYLKGNPKAPWIINSLQAFGRIWLPEWPTLLFIWIFPDILWEQQPIQPAAASVKAKPIQSWKHQANLLTETQSIRELCCQESEPAVSYFQH